MQKFINNGEKKKKLSKNKDTVYMFLSRFRQNQVISLSQLYFRMGLSINHHRFYEPWVKRIQSVLFSRGVPITSRSNRCGIVFYFVYVSWCVDIRRPERKGDPHARVRLAERDVANKLASSLSWWMIKYRSAK
jgi:hypothetical protein